MRRVDDPMTGDVICYFDDGMAQRFDRRAVQEYGLPELLKAAGRGADIPTGRLDVMQSGRKVGTVPATFDPMRIKSTSFWYEPRGGDFTRDGDVWVAARMLGPGDLEAVPGFVRDRTS
jgi:hypothetical protein